MYPDQNQPNQPGQPIQPGPQLQPGQQPQPVQPTLPQNPYAPIQPQVSGPAPNQPYGSQTITNGTTITPPKKINVLLVISIGIVVLLIIITVIALMLSGNSSKTATPTTTKKTDTSSLVPVPATDDSVQQTNDAISQNISSLNDTAEFPADALSDQKLNID